MERTREADLPAIIAHNDGARIGRAVRGTRARGRTLRAAAALLALLLLCAAFSACADDIAGDPDSGGAALAEAGGLPVLRIATKNGVSPTFCRVDPPEGNPGHTITDNAFVPGVLEATGLPGTFSSRMKIRVRGNTTACSAGQEGKLPYKLVLDTAADLLGNGRPDRRFVLLAGAGSDLVTWIGFAAGRLCGVDWVPDCRYVELELNGDRRGIYLLTEAPDGLSREEHCGRDGFVVESDIYWWNQEVSFRSDILLRVMGLVIKYPENVKESDRRFREIRAYFEALEASVLDGSYEAFIDVDSFLAWAMTRDVIGCSDAGGNNFFYLDPDGASASGGAKLRMGPLWDLDSGFRLKDEWYDQHKSPYTYLSYLFQDRSFSGRYAERWRELSPSLYADLERTVLALCDGTEEAIDRGRRADAERWGRRFVPVRQEAERRLAWLRERVEWIDAHIGLPEEAFARISGDGSELRIALRDDGYEEVLFPTWSDAGGQDDLVWYEAEPDGDGYWIRTVDVRAHAPYGLLSIHMYAVKDGGERQMVNYLNIYVRDPDP